MPEPKASCALACCNQGVGARQAAHYTLAWEGVRGKYSPFNQSSGTVSQEWGRVMACLYRAGWLGEQQVGDKTFGSLGHTCYGACQVWATVTVLGLLEGFVGWHERSGAAGWFGA
jgi:hypothetical protein